MSVVGKFEKVKFGTFLNALSNVCSDKFNSYCVPAVNMWEDIKVPRRATRGSAGYDFFAPFDFSLKPFEEIVVPTGIKARIDDGWALWCIPKSGLGFKYYTKLANTVGLIDSDYYNNKNNEGHIMCKIRNESNEVLHVDKGKAFFQAIFLPFGTAENDGFGDDTPVREGGFGSTNS